VQQNLFNLEFELEEKLTETQKETMARMKAKINELINLIHTWLRVISVDVKKLQETFKLVSMAAVISKAVENVRPQAVRKNIKIVPTIQEPLSMMNGDEGTLVEVIVNILGNGIKFSREGSKILVKAEEKEKILTITISDSGIGISKEDLPYIFEDFYTGDTGQVAQKSSGLGLAISKRIVEAHNGSISVESELGKGTAFTINLPAQ